MHLLSRVVTESEEGVVEQVPEEGQPSVEVGFDICGSSGEPNTSTNQGKPQSIQPFSLYFTNILYTLSIMIYALVEIGIG
jgi:hypothetical protein